MKANKVKNITIGKRLIAKMLNNMKKKSQIDYNKYCGDEHDVAQNLNVPFHVLFKIHRNIPKNNNIITENKLNRYDGYDLAN